MSRPGTVLLALPLRPALAELLFPWHQDHCGQMGAVGSVLSWVAWQLPWGQIPLELLAGYGAVAALDHRTLLAC